jgi:hypothetical protein
MQQMLQQLLAMQEKADADRKADREELQYMMKANREDIKSGQAKMIAAIKGKMDAMIANIKYARKKTTACQEVTGANPQTIEPNPGEKETEMEQQEIPNEEVAVHSLRTCRTETAASQEDTETKPDPGKMQSMEEHQEIPKEKAAVMPVGGLRKRPRDRNLAVGHRQKPKRRIRASCESRRRLTVPSKKITRRTTVAWHKRNVFRKIGTQGNCGLRSKFTAAGIKMTRHARVAWHKENYIRKYWTMDKVGREAQRAQMLRRRLRSHQENDKQIRDLGGRRPLYRRKKRPTKNGIGECKSGHRSPLGSRGTQKTAICEIVSMKIAQQVAEIFRKTRKLEMANQTPSWLRKIRKWTLWRGWPPPKCKKR